VRPRALRNSGTFDAAFLGMKVLPKKLLRLTLFAIAVTSLFSVRPAQAGYMVTLEQVGANVVATGSGPIDLTGLTLLATGVAGAEIEPSSAIIQNGPTSIDSVDFYTGLTGPFSFGERHVDDCLQWQRRQGRGEVRRGNLCAVRLSVRWRSVEQLDL